MCWLIMLMMNGKIHVSPAHKTGSGMAVSASCFHCIDCVPPYYSVLRCSCVMQLFSSSSCSDPPCPPRFFLYLFKTLCFKYGLHWHCYCTFYFFTENIMKHRSSSHWKNTLVEVKAMDVSYRKLVLRTCDCFESCSASSTIGCND